MKTLFTSLCVTILATVGLAQAPGGVSSGLMVWLKPDAAGITPVADGTAVSNWNDASGMGNHATQSTVTARPLYYNNVFNGNPAISNTTNRFLNVDFSEIDNTNYTIITVSRRTNSSGTLLGIIGLVSGQGLSVTYQSSTSARYLQYANSTSITIPAYTSNEQPAIMACQFNQAVGKKIWRILDGVNVNNSGTNKTMFPSTGQGRIGRGQSTDYFRGYIAEVIAYNRVLTSQELMQIHTYLSVKYGLSVPMADHLYPLDATFQNDVFGIGNSTASSLNQTKSRSAGRDDILEISNPSGLGNDEYLICGNDNASNLFVPYVGSNCTAGVVLSRNWRFRHIGDVGTVKLRFDLTGVTGFTASQLKLLVDLDGDGYDDETPIEGTYSAPYFSVEAVSIPNGAKVTLCTAKSHYYVVASGLMSEAIWSDSPTGTPAFLNAYCEHLDCTILAGNTVDNDWPSFVCHDMTLEAGAVFNAGAASNQNIYIHGNVVVNGTWNDQNCSVYMPGSYAQNITGNQYLRVQNWNITNTAGVNINCLGAIVYGNLSITGGATLNTNDKLTLWSDAVGTGEIQSLSEGTLNGPVNIRRYRPSGPMGWINLACPLQSAIVENWDDDIMTTGFTGSDYPAYNFNSIKYYNENLPGGPNDGYVGVASDGEALVPGRGYFVYMQAGTATIRTRGIINSGPFNMNPQYTSNGSGAGWNLMGNPYPATIDWASTSWTKSDMNNAVYIYRASINQYASYVNGVGTNGGDGLIAPGQSFFVEANSPGAVLILNEDCKSKSPATFRSMESNARALSLKISNSEWQDETVLIRNEQATKSFDRAFDAKKLRSPMEEAPYMATLDNNGEELSINNISLDGEEVIVPIRMEAGVSGTYTLQVTGVSGFANGACVTLEDMFTGTTYVLSDDEMVEINLQAGDHTLRYQVRMSAVTLSSVTDTDCTSRNNGSAEVMLPVNTTSVVECYNVSGELLSTTTPVNGVARVESLIPGNYSARITNNGACGTTAVDFVIAQKSELNASAIVMPSSCPNTDDGGISINIGGGQAPYTVVWNNGMEGLTIENATAGKYTAAVRDSEGCESSFEFEVQSVSTLVSKFDVSKESVELISGEATIDFTNTSSGADNYFWNFGDGSNLSEEENPSHAYTDAGIYEVMLKANSDNCESVSTRTVAVTDYSYAEEFAASILATMTDKGVQMTFLFDELKNIRISAYNMVGQQLIEPIVGQFGKQTITFSDRRYASNALIEVTDLNTGEKTLIRLGR